MLLGAHAFPPLTPLSRVRTLTCSHAFLPGIRRVRYSRLSRVRRLLGYQGPGPDWSDADKISLDDNYMAVDIVINWAADGVVLCFIHAVVDISDRDNDEVHKTGWTNWCGTPHMPVQQVELLFSRLVQDIPQNPTMERVFQILFNEQDRPLCFSWPPDRQTVQGGPEAKDFAKLAAEVTIGNTTHGTDAKTSCTRRYKALQNMPFGPEGDREVESIFIPYGEPSRRLVASSPVNRGLQVLLSSLVTKSARIAPQRTVPTHRTPPSNITTTTRTVSRPSRSHISTIRKAIPRKAPRRRILRRTGRGHLTTARSRPTASGRPRIQWRPRHL